MNIFASFPCPKQSAQYLDNKRVIKMILESAQLLFTALYKNSPESFKTYDYSPLKLDKINCVWKQPRRLKLVYYLFSERVYAPTHSNHPATIWTSLNRSNYLWVLDHFIALNEEYTRKYEKTHKCMEMLSLLEKGAELMPIGLQTTHVNCAANQSKGLSYKHIDDVYLAYRMYLQDLWENYDKT